ncbi:MAG: hypothetical protein AMXMBFR58_14390 [Phycisphaerae bacterium]
MPKDPLPASSPGKLPTEGIDIGHVAPSFPSEELWNTLVIRPAYRLSLRLGEFDPLFPDEPNTERGRMARLQALGLFYWPLDHTKATQAFRGIPGVAANPGTGAQAVDAFKGAWEYFWRDILKEANDSNADTKLAEMLEERILAQLPPPPEDPMRPTRDNFAKIRIPGGYTILKSWMSNFLLVNDDPAYPHSLGDDQYALETKFRDANKPIGKIPLVALVEKLDPYTLEWKPAKDCYVYFQAVEPEPLPAFDTTLDVNAPTQFNRPPLRESTLGPPAATSGSGPAKLTDSEENPTGATKPSNADPQKPNAHKDRGGLRGNGNLNDCSDVADVLFSTTSTPGFNAEHSPARAKKPDLYELATKATPSGESHKHAVRAKTNDRGEAGVIFTPSRCGGDTYKIRAYIGPADTAKPLPHETDGTGARAIKVDTGTMVVWRNLRISRYVKQPSSGVNATLLGEVNNTTYNIATADDYLTTCFMIDNSGANVGVMDLNNSLQLRTGYSPQVGLGQGFDSLPVNFARAFLEVEFDHGTAPETMSDSDWKAARRTALADAILAAPALGLSLNIPVLMYMETGAPALSVGDAVTLVPMRTPEAYNAHPSVTSAQRIDPAGTTVTGNSIALVEQLWSEFLVVGVARHFANNGYIPGLCLVQAPYGSTWSLIGLASDSSGTSLEYRAGLLYAGRMFYSDTTRVLTAGPPWLGYDTTSNACHEFGHVLLRLHGPGKDAHRTSGGGGASAAVHDGINGSICVMSYKSCEGNFCAKCLFAFRGWKNLP